jgi:hypothetical protein
MPVRLTQKATSLPAEACERRLLCPVNTKMFIAARWPWPLLVATNRRMVLKQPRQACNVTLDLKSIR